MAASNEITVGGHTFDWLDLGKYTLAACLFLGYLGILAICMFVDVPATSATIIIQGMAVLGPIIGVVASNMWPKGSEKDKQTIQNLSEKVPPVTGEARESVEQGNATGQSS